MALQKFNKLPVRKSEETVSLWSKGQLGLSRALVKNNELAQYKRVAMYYDPDNAQMVFQFTNAEDVTGTTGVSISSNGVGLISAKPYMDYFKIDYSKAVKFPAHFDKTNSTLTLNISEGVQSDRIARKVKASVVDTVVPENVVPIIPNAILEPIAPVPVAAPQPATV